MGGWFKGLRDKAEQVVSEQQAAFAKGKVVGVDVNDEAGNVLIAAGQRVDDAALERVRQAGKISVLAGAVAKGQAQDLREAVQTQVAKTESAREARLLDSVEEYREVRRYLGRILTMDVTDIRGQVIVPSGKKLEDADIQLARDAGLLSALLAAAEQALPTATTNNTPAPASIAPPPPTRPAPTFLNTPDEEAEFS